MRDVYLFLFCLPDLCSRLGASQPGELGGGAKARQVIHCNNQSKVTQPRPKPGKVAAWFAERSHACIGEAYLPVTVF